ncbi:hypothetical protein V8C26DRAFT_411193 [Trichoderma gracile]
MAESSRILIYPRLLLTIAPLHPSTIQSMESPTPMYTNPANTSHPSQPFYPIQTIPSSTHHLISLQLQYTTSTTPSKTMAPLNKTTPINHPSTGPPTQIRQLTKPAQPPMPNRHQSAHGKIS